MAAPPQSSYDYVGVLGAGAFGEVILARHVASGERVAIKKMRRGPHLNLANLEAEAVNHANLWHPHVVQFKEIFLSPSNVNIVMEYANGGSLINRILHHGAMPEAEARHIFQQVVLGLDYCHRKGVANRDLKLDNTLLHRPVPGGRLMAKLCDFGYSKHDSRSARSRVGTECYMAPEVLSNDNRSRYDPKQADVWSLGVMLYGMLTKTFPYGGNSEGEMTPAAVAERIARIRGRALEDPPGVSPACAALVRRLLEPDPGARITVAQIMQDPWFLEALPPDLLAEHERHAGLGRSPSLALSDGDIRRIVQRA